MGWWPTCRAVPASPLNQDLVVHGHDGAKLAVTNIGDGATTGPAEAAHGMSDLVKPASAIAALVSEVRMVGGKVRPGSMTEAFTKVAKMPVHLPLPGKAMAFDAGAKCAAGC